VENNVAIISEWVSFVLGDYEDADLFFFHFPVSPTVDHM
jgi:hypothetical protein